MDDNRDFSSLLHTKCDRKAARRTKKKLKAVCRLAHAQHKNIETVIREKFDHSKERKKRDKRRRQRARKKMKKVEEHEAAMQKEQVEDEEDSFPDENCTLEQFQAEAEHLRQQRLQGDYSDEDDKEIRRLESKLKKGKKRRRTKESAADDSDNDELERILLGKDGNEDEE